MSVAGGLLLLVVVWAVRQLRVAAMLAAKGVHGQREKGALAVAHHQQQQRQARRTALAMVAGGRHRQKQQTSPAVARQR